MTHLTREEYDQFCDNCQVYWQDPHTACPQCDRLLGKALVIHPAPRVPAPEKLAPDPFHLYHHESSDS